MEPIPLKTRRVYSIVSFTLFAIVLLAAAFYASGYRLSDYSLVRTGGIFVSVPISDATVSLNGEEVGTTGFLSKSFFIDNLSPGTYVLQVSVEDYYPWTKTLTVDAKVVSDTNAFLVPQGLSALEVIATTSKKVATTTRGVSSAEYLELLDLFVEKPPKDDIATSTPDDLDRGIELYVEEGDVIVKWTKSLTSAPSAFCSRPGSCIPEVIVEKGKEVSIFAKFFRGGVVYQTEKSGIYFAEIDLKPVQTVVPLYSKSGAIFRIYKGEIFIKDGDSLFVISGF